MGFQIKKYNKLRVKGATLLESLTALAIVSAVMGAAFTLYTQTVSKQAQVLKTRAAFLQNEFEKNILSEEDLSNDFVTVSTQSEPYNGIQDLKHITLIISTKQGKKLTEKHYIKYIPGQA